jgi:hypothetical protein
VEEEQILIATDGSTTGFIDGDTERLRKGISTKTGFEWSITQTLLD